MARVSSVCGFSRLYSVLKPMECELEKNEGKFSKEIARVGRKQNIKMFTLAMREEELNF